MSAENQKTGALLVNLGTPAAPDPAAVGKYLREFLGDPCVINLPGPLRWLLVNGLIVPTRAAKSAEAYQKIWTRQGSPLLVHSYALRDALAERLVRYPLDIAMRYGRPTIQGTLERLSLRGCTRVVCLPLYPHATASSTGTASEAIRQAAAELGGLEVEILKEYFDHPAWIEAVRSVTAPALAAEPADHVLFSFHGLPLRQVHKSGAGGACLKGGDCVEPISGCYRAQCLSSAEAIAAALELSPGSWSSAFQSRLGPTKWLEPSTTDALTALGQSGVKRLAVLAPGFAADNLETLEELQLKGRDTFLQAGGESLHMIPCLNAEAAWVEALASMLEPHLGERLADTSPATAPDTSTA
jgi:ferrochelatase